MSRAARPAGKAARPKPAAVPPVAIPPVAVPPAAVPPAAVPPVAVPLITAAICTYQRYDMAAEAVTSLLCQSLPPDRYRIVVVDNSPDAALSQDASEPWRDESNLLWIHEKTAGLSHARNVAIAAAATPLIAFLDDDAVACHDWLEAVLECFKSAYTLTEDLGFDSSS